MISRKQRFSASAAALGLAALAGGGLAVLASVAAGSAHAAETGPVARVTGGRVSGKLLRSGGAVFRGLPFARPPVGTLRWREPQPVEPWKGVRDASKSCAPCSQASAGWNEAEAAASREDCLYLDVWAPHWPPTGREAVMVWIHGGANTGGAGGSDPLYDGSQLIRRDVLLVIVEYRLGVFGFFAHPELTRESPHHASGNYGLLDQLAALRWVRRNIAAFGGDPNRVTVFGQSAGAVDLALLMATKQSKGLFHRGIGQSGAVLTMARPQTLAEAEESGTRLAAVLKAPAQGTLAFLRARSPAELLGASSGAGPIGATLDGWLFDRPPADVFAAGKQSKIPLIVGSNATEFDGPDSPASLRQTIAARYGPLAERAYRLYGASGPADEGTRDPVYGGPSQQWAADTAFRCPVAIQAEWHGQATHPVWVYQFDRAIPPRPATAHSSELPYVFGNLYAKGSQAGEFTAADRRLSNSLMTYWTNFAKTGDPNGAGQPRWPRYEGDAPQLLEFTAAAEVVRAKDPRRAFCALYREALGPRPATP